MNAKRKPFLDSNLLVYAHTDVDPSKQQTVQQIIASEPTCISTQVFKEVANVLNKKFRFDWSVVQTVIQEIAQRNEVHINTFDTIYRGCQIADRYRFSFYDSLIIAAALEANATILYSEDMRDGQVIEGTLTIQNPFA